MIEKADIELNEIEKILNKGWGSDINSMKEYLFQLSVFKARINELLSQWEAERLNKVESFIRTYESYITQMKQYEYRDRLAIYCKEANTIIFRLEKLNSVIETQIEALRTIVSFNKEELKLN
jgi:hypothetical protein